MSYVIGFTLTLVILYVVSNVPFLHSWRFAKLALVSSILYIVIRVLLRTIFHL